MKQCPICKRPSDEDPPEFHSIKCIDKVSANLNEEIRRQGRSELEMLRVDVDKLRKQMAHIMSEFMC